MNQVKDFFELLKTIFEVFKLITIILLEIAFLMCPVLIALWTKNNNWMFGLFFTICIMTGIVSHYFPMSRKIR